MSCDKYYLISIRYLQHLYKQCRAGSGQLEPPQTCARSGGSSAFQLRLPVELKFPHFLAQVWGVQAGPTQLYDCTFRQEQVADGRQELEIVDEDAEVDGNIVQQHTVLEERHRAVGVEPLERVPGGRHVTR